MTPPAAPDPHHPRRVLILAHTGREDAIAAALGTSRMLQDAGLIPVMLTQDVTAIQQAVADGTIQHQGPIAQTLGTACTLEEIDLGVVLGGDGSVLRAAELVREAAVPLLAVNLGHVGFLAESERTDLRRTVQAIADQDYEVEERLTIEVNVYSDGALRARTWALNEASVEKSNRERMLEVVTSVDGRPISTYGCDGVVMATPTGSTAYAFSAGGPVVWPEVQALLMVPISAHALFARPLVVSPDSVLAVEVLRRTNEPGLLWCDGRRTVDLPPGARVEVMQSSMPVLLARLSRTPFTDRLVRKFDLPTEGWRGPISSADRVEAATREAARHHARHGDPGSAPGQAGSAGVSVVEPHHLAPRPGVVPPSAAAIPIVIRPDGTPTPEPGADTGPDWDGETGVAETGSAEPGAGEEDGRA